MRMTNKSYDNMNKLMAACFNANAIFDNLAYNLDYYYYNEIAEVVHHKVAHAMPELADLISNEMLVLSARPVRYDINGYQEDIPEIKIVFKKLLDTLMDIRLICCNMIEVADMDDSVEVKLFGEEFLMKIQNYIKQAEEWVNAAEKLEPEYLNVHIDKYTHFIAL